jgi:hypothetical protein
VLRLADGRSAAVTNTCAAIALDIVQPGDHAAVAADRGAARSACAVAGSLLGLDGDEVARRMLTASADAVGALAMRVADEYELERPVIVAVGGGAGGLGRYVADALHLECHVPEMAEVISAVGDALSLVRSERERSVTDATASIRDALAREAEADCIAAGADPASVDVRVELDDDHTTLRAVATGMVGLEAGARPGRAALGEREAAAVIAELGGSEPVGVGAFWISTGGPDELSPTMVIDRLGDPVASGRGAVAWLDPAGPIPSVGDLVARATRRRGPVTIDPVVWLLQGNRAVQVPPGEAVQACQDLDSTLGAGALVVLQG